MLNEYFYIIADRKNRTFLYGRDLVDLNKCPHYPTLTHFYSYNVQLMVMNLLG